MRSHKSHVSSLSRTIESVSTFRLHSVSPLVAGLGPIDSRFRIKFHRFLHDTGWIEISFTIFSQRFFLGPSFETHCTYHGYSAPEPFSWQYSSTVVNNNLNSFGVLTFCKLISFISQPYSSYSLRGRMFSHTVA
jgi:hypothetical protein